MVSEAIDYYTYVHPRAPSEWENPGKYKIPKKPTK